jgi:hypothetical protein
MAVMAVLAVKYCCFTGLDGMVFSVKTFLTSPPPHLSN